MGMPSFAAGWMMTNESLIIKLIKNQSKHQTHFVNILISDPFRILLWEKALKYQLKWLLRNPISDLLAVHNSDASHE